MLPNAIGLGICNPCSWSIGFCSAVVDCASFVDLGFPLGSGGITRGSAAILDCADIKVGLAAESCCVDEAGCVVEAVMKPSVGWMLLTLNASSTAATPIPDLESEWFEA